MATIGNLRFDPAHAEQLAAWNGDEGEYWAAHADRFDRALAKYQKSFMAAARIGDQDNVLDVGCGTGETTMDAARIARTGSVLGVDLSAAMLAVACERVERAGLTNVAFVQADAQIHAFQPESFDVVLGRTSAMFFADKPVAFANLSRAPRSDGRLALLVWRPAAANEWIREITSALAAGRQLPDPPPEGPQPFSMGDPDLTRQWLTAAGSAT